MLLLSKQDLLHSNRHRELNKMKLSTAAIPILKLAIPLIVIQLCQASLGLMDSLIAGRYHFQDLAAIGLGSNLWTPVGILITGILYVLVPRISALVAGTADKRADELVDLRVEGEKLAWLAGLTALLVVQLLGLLPPLLIEDTRVAGITTRYLQFAALSMPGFALFVMYRFLCEGHSQLIPVLLTALILAVFNPLLNVVLVNGLYGLPEMGGAGCGIATAVSTWIAAAIMRTACKRQLPQLFAPVRRVRAEENAWKKLLGHGLPIGVSLVLEVLALTALAILAAQLGTRVIAAHQIAINIAIMIFMIPVAMSSAATIRVAFYRGKEDVTGLHKTAGAVMLIAAGYGAVMTVAILVVGDRFLNLFSHDQQVIAIVSGLLLFIAAFQLLDAIQITAAGVLRGMEEYVKPLIVVLAIYWGLVIPLGYIIGVKGWLLDYSGINTIWFMLSVGLSIAAFVLSYQSMQTLKNFSLSRVEVATT